MAVRRGQRLAGRCARAVLLVLAVGLWASGGLQAAQDGGGVETSLTIWAVRPVTSAERAIQRAQNDLRDIQKYRESTAGSFGRSASDVGQTAGSYGTAASSTGQTASSVGINAGSYGGSTSSAASNVPSQTAGSYGTTAGSFGTAASDFHGPPAQVTPEETTGSMLRSAEWQRFKSHVEDTFRGVTIKYVEVPGLELRERLAKAAGTSAYPDVLLLPSTDYPDLLLGALPWQEQQPALDKVALFRVGQPFPWPVTPAPRTEIKHIRPARSVPFAHALGMVGAPHPLRTRLFLEWLDAGAPDRPWLFPSLPRVVEEVPPKSPEALAAATAKQVTEAVFSGDTAGGTADAWADPQMARFTLAQAVSILYVPRDRVPGDLRVLAVPVEVAANERFAVVQLSAEVVSGNAYGRFFLVVVMRRSGGAWKVLHFSLDLSEEAARQVYDLLKTCARPGPKQPSTVLPVSLASPRDGEDRSAHGGLELWWDNNSGARLLVVEYQGMGSGEPGQPHLYVVDDRDPKPETRLEVPFGAAFGPVRWRVWSVGDDGTVRLTDWRTVNLLR